MVQINDLKGDVKFESVTNELLKNFFDDAFSEDHSMTCICILYEYVCILVYKKLVCFLNFVFTIVYCDC